MSFGSGDVQRGGAVFEGGVDIRAFFKQQAHGVSMAVRCGGHQCSDAGRLLAFGNSGIDLCPLFNKHADGIRSALSRSEHQHGETVIVGGIDLRAALG